MKAAVAKIHNQSSRRNVPSVHNATPPINGNNGPQETRPLALRLLQESSHSPPDPILLLSKHTAFCKFEKKPSFLFVHEPVVELLRLRPESFVFPLFKMRKLHLMILISLDLG